LYPVLDDGRFQDLTSPSRSGAGVEYALPEVEPVSLMMKKLQSVELLSIKIDAH